MVKKAKASTSKASESSVDSVECEIGDIRNKMHVPSSSLKKMKSISSVTFITNGKISSADVCRFYLAEKELNIPSTEESKRIEKRITNDLEYVDAAEQLMAIKIQLNESKKEIESIMKETRALAPKENTLKEEVRKQLDRLIPADNKFCDLWESYAFLLKNLSRQGNTSLVLAQICQTYSNFGNDLTGETGRNYSQCTTRTRLIEHALESAQAALEELQEIVEVFNTKVRVEEVAVKTFPDDSPTEIMKNVEDLKGYVKKFDLKMKTSDAKGKLILKAFRTYVADVKLLINFYADTAKAYKVALQEIIALHGKVISSIAAHEIIKKGQQKLISQFDYYDNRVKELGIIIRECQQCITQNSIGAGGPPNNRTFVF